MNATKKASWFKTMAAAFAASVMATGAQGAEKITVDEVANHYPWDGKVDCVTTLSGLDTTGTYKYEGVFTLSVKKDGAKVCKVVTNAFASADGTYTNTFDCAALFGAGVYPNGGIVVDLVRKERQLGFVQLWKDGPYWAECNVGATKPEEYGYYFWWGDTVGYTNTGSAWISVKDGAEISFNGDSAPANSSCGKDIPTLIGEGCIDSTTSNLVTDAEHDAATAHLGDPWRMPTDAEISNLISRCSWSYTTDWNGTGVAGCVVTGKEDGYTKRSIFLPATGYGSNSSTYNAGTSGSYWSSTPYLDSYHYNAWDLIINLDSKRYYRAHDRRSFGQSVRPVRTSVQ